jgi:hypothetical protein
LTTDANVVIMGLVLRAFLTRAVATASRCIHSPSRRRREEEAAVKPAPFEYLAPRTIPEVLARLQAGEDAKLLAGGQSLVPMMNVRALLQRAMRRAAGGDFGHVIHLTHGIHPAARMTGESFIEDMRAGGNNAVGLGIPFWLPGGGENHPDAVVTEQSIWIDGRSVVADGALVNPPHLAALAEQLVPRIAPR